MKMKILVLKLTLPFIFGSVVFCQTQEKSIEKLIQELKNSTKTSDRGNAALALGGIRDKRAIQPLKEALVHDKEHRVRGYAAQALGEIADTSSVILLIQALTEDIHLVQDDAAEALGKIGDNRAVKPLVEALMKDGRSVGVRCQAALALGEIADTSAVLPLIEALNDYDDIITCVVQGLDKIGDARAIEPLKALLQVEVFLLQTTKREYHESAVEVIINALRRFYRKGHESAKVW